MKRFIYALMSLIFLFGSTLIINVGAVGTAFAQSTCNTAARYVTDSAGYLGTTAYVTNSAGYARATTREAYLYTNYDLSASLFAVPYTYLVQIIQEDDSVYYVKYAEDEGTYKAIYGYCKKEDFAPVYTQPAVTYLHKTVTVTFAPQELTPPLPTLSELTVEAAFYGTYYSGGTAYSYVLCGDSFGYIAGANDDYPLLSTEQETTSGSVKTNKKTSYAPQIITAVTLCALAAFALVLIFLSSQKIKKSRGYKR